MTIGEGHHFAVDLNKADTCRRCDNDGAGAGDADHRYDYDDCFAGAAFRQQVAQRQRLQPTPTWTLTDFATLVEQNLSSRSGIVVAAGGQRILSAPMSCTKATAATLPTFWITAPGVRSGLPTATVSGPNMTLRFGRIGGSVTTAGSAGTRMTSWGGFPGWFSRPPNPAGPTFNPPLPLPKLSGQTDSICRTSSDCDQLMWPQGKILCRSDRWEFALRLQAQPRSGGSVALMTSS